MYFFSMTLTAKSDWVILKSSVLLQEQELFTISKRQ